MLDGSYKDNSKIGGIEMKHKKPKKIMINGERTSDLKRLHAKWEGKHPLFTPEEIKKAVHNEGSLVIADICLHGEYERRYQKAKKKEFEKILLEGISDE